MSQLAPRGPCGERIIKVTANCGSTYTSCITAAEAQGIEGNFTNYSALVTKLCMQVANRPGGLYERDGTHAALTAKIEQLEMQVKQCQTTSANNATSRERERGPQECYRCGKKHKGGIKECTEPATSCPFTFADGTKCGKDHLLRFCFFADPTRCKNIKLRGLIERKIKAKSTTSDAAHNANTKDDDSEDDEYAMFHTKITLTETEAPITALLSMDDYLHDATIGLIDLDELTTKMMSYSYLVIDSGASSHISFDQRCITDTSSHKPVNVAIKTGNAISHAISRGPMSFNVKDKYGNSITLTRTMLYAPDFSANLFSTMQGKQYKVPIRGHLHDDNWGRNRDPLHRSHW